MRGIERVLAAILLLAAVGGAALFARESGSGPVRAVHLAAPPQQHLAAPGTVLIAPTSSPDHSQWVLRLAVSPQVTTRPATSAQGTPLRPVTIVRPRPRPQPPAPAPSPTPTATPTPVAMPAPVQTPQRIVASAQPVPSAPIKATPLPPLDVTSANVKGLVPSPPVIDAPPVVTEPVQGVHIKGIAEPAGN